MQYRIILSAVLALVGLSGQVAHAVTVELSPTSRGAYRSDTGAFGTGGSGTPTGNYLAGLNGGNEFRDFFVYDLAAVSGLIVQAELQVHVADFTSPDASEIFSLFDVTTPIAALTGNTGGLAAFDDLGSGASYGTIDLSEADDSTVVTIALDGSALAALNASVGGDFALGGALTSLGGATSESAFGGTLGASFVSKLVLTVIPTSSQSLDPSSRGAYRSDTGAFGTGGSGTPTGNYLAGLNGGNEFRDFFVYDLAAVSGLIVQAELQVHVADFTSPDASEIFSLFDVTTPIAALTGNTGGLAAFDDLGSGASYGTIDLSEADDSTVVTIPLGCDALAALNASVGGDFALGGALTSLGGATSEFAFGGTLGASFVSKLVLTVIPTSSQSLDPSSRGAYRSDTGAFGTGGSGTPTGNYLAGLNGGNEFRDFFVYDLAAVSGLIVQAELQVHVADFTSPDASEIFSLFDVTTPIAALTGNTGGLAAFDDLGSGASYGTIDLSEADDSTVVTIALDGSALAALNASVGGDFALGGALTSLGGATSESAFGGTLGASFVSKLVLTVIPNELVAVLGPFSRGAYRSDTGAFGTGGSGTPTGNYLAGLNSGNEYRNFFAFDGRALEGCVVLAQLELAVGTVSTPQTEETFSLFDVTSDLVALTSDSGGFAAFDDLGEGISYGEVNLTTADANGEVAISLNASGVAALNAGVGGDFALGGAITTLSGPNSQFVFGSTLGPQSSLAVVTLPVPEPSPTLMLASGIALLAFAMRRKSSQRLIKATVLSSLFMRALFSIPSDLERSR